MGMYSPIRSGQVSIVVLLGLISSAAQGADKPLYQRWAIISTQSAAETGIADLLTVELSQGRDVELVDRDQVEAATKELELAAALGSQAADLRLRLGLRLKADALIFLSLEALEGKPCLKLVVSECLYGARLRVAYLPYDQAQLQPLAVRCSEVVRQVRSDYAAGVQRVIGMAHFLSKNLDHKYDHLQAEYTYLIEAALTGKAGLALIELEEAQAIRREFDADKDRTRERQLPLLVEGEFEMVRVKNQRQPDVQLALRIQGRAGSKPRTIQHRGKFSETAKFLSRNIPQAILADAKQTADLVSSADQLTWLEQRADRFSRDGAWRHAVGLREAALLLAPDNLEQELLLIEDYSQIVRAELYDVPSDQRDNASPVFRKAVEVRVEALARGLDHLAQLIRDQRLEASQSLELWEKLRAYWLEIPFPKGISEQASETRLGQNLLARAEDLEDRFISETASLILKLPLTLHPLDSHPRLIKFRSVFVDTWCELVLNATLDRCDRTYHTKGDLDRFVIVYSKLIPDDYVHVRQTTWWLTFYPPQFMRSPSSDLSYDPARLVGKDAITDADWRTFLRRLKQSSHRGAALTGQYNLAQLFYHKVQIARLEMLSRRAQGEPPSTAELEPVLTELAEMVTQWKQTPWVTLPRPDETPNRSFYDPIGFVVIADRLLHPPQDTPSPRKVEPSHWETVKIGRITFEPLHVQGDVEGDTAVPMQARHIRLGDALDAYFDHSTIWYMRQRDIFEQVAHDAEIMQDDVQWDGKHLWAATRKSGLWLFDTDGKMCGRVNEENGLPPCDLGIKLHVVGPDKICAIGSFGEHGRGWCAMITPQEKSSGYQVDVFHRATEVHNDPKLPDKTELVFEPGRMQELDLGAGQERVLAIERGSRKHFYPFSRLLLVNLDTRAVTLAPEQLKDTRFAPSIIVPRPWNGDLAWRRLMNDKRIAEESFFHNGAVYCFQSHWRRFSPQGTEVETLVAQDVIPTTSQYEMSCAGITAHYGLTLWGGISNELPKFYRLSIDEAKPDAAQ